MIATLLLSSLLTLNAHPLDGDWQLQQLVEDGRPEEKVPDIQWTFVGDKLRYSMGDKSFDTPVTIDDSKSPATIDFSDGRRQHRGIYDIKGDTLRICIADLRDEGRRPESFEKNPFRVRVMIFERVTANDKERKASVEKREPLWKIEFDETASSIAVVAEGTRVVIVDKVRIDGQHNLHWLDAKDGKLLASFSDQEVPPRGARRPSLIGAGFSAEFVATASGADIVLREPGSGRPMHVLRKEDDAERAIDEAIVDLRYAPDGRTLVAALANGTIELWDVKTRARVRDAKTGGEAVVTVLADNRHAFTAERNNQVRLWRIDKGEPLADFHPQLGILFAVVSAKIGNRIAVAGEGGAKLLEVSLEDAKFKEFAVLRETPGPVATLTTDGRMRVLAASGANGSVEFYNFKTGALLDQLKWAKSRYPTACAFSGDSRMLATCRRRIPDQGPAQGSIIELWEIEDLFEDTRTPLATYLAGKPADGIRLKDEADGHYESVTSAGKEGVRAKDYYLYFTIDDRRLYNVAENAEPLSIRIVLFDNRKASFDVQYDAHPEPNAKGDGTWTATSRMKTLGTGRWQEFVVALPRAKFSNRQNGGADFRLRAEEGLVLEVAEVSLLQEK